MILENNKGLYISAFASAIFEESRPYQEAIIDLEMQILDNPEESFSNLLLMLQPFEIILSELCSLINQVMVTFKF